MRKVIIFYTNNSAKDAVIGESLNSIIKAKGDIPLVITAQEPLNMWLPDQAVNIVNRRAANHASMYRQIVQSLEIARKYKPTHVFFCEHDVLYPEGYFDCNDDVDGFTYTDNKLYYMLNQNKLIEYPGNVSLSTLFCRYELALSAFKRRVYRCNKMNMVKAGWTVSEPGKSKQQGTFQRIGWCTEDTSGDMLLRQQDLPLIDIRDDHNLSKFSAGEKKQVTCDYWQEVLDDIYHNTSQK